LGFGVALIFVPNLGITAFGGAIAGWWIVVGVVTVIGAFAGNRAGIEVELRQPQRGSGRLSRGVIAVRSCRV
jgi:hypothetical protein